MSQLPVTENDLHAYVDQVLPAPRRAEVEQWLVMHPEERARVHAYVAQKQSLKALFAPVLDEAVPVRLSALAAPPEKPFLSRWSLQRLAAGFVLALFGGVAGWLMHAQFSPVERLARLSPLPHQAAVAHLVFSPDVRRPVEVPAAQEEQLVAWLSKRLGTPVRPPRLGALGYELVGGRLLPGNSGPVAQFMYQEASGQRLTLYVSTENVANQASPGTGFRFAQEGAINVFYWIDGKFAYALSASIDKGELARLATAVYDQLEHP